MKDKYELLKEKVNIEEIQRGMVETLNKTERFEQINITFLWGITNTLFAIHEQNEILIKLAKDEKRERTKKKSR